MPDAVLRVIIASMKRSIKLILRLIVSAVLLVVLFYRVDLKQLLNTMLRVGVGNFLELSALYLLSQVVSSIRWSMVIRSLGARMGVVRLLLAYLLGMFANLFLPSTIGGDAIKAYVVSKVLGLRLAVSSIFLERYNGLVALLLISLASVFIFKGFFDVRLKMLVVGVVIFAMFAPFLLGLRYFRRFKRLDNFFMDIMRFHKSSLILPVTLLSFLVQGIVILVYVLASRMLGFDVPAAYFLAFIPIINLISFLPISFNGVGVREFSFVYFFSLAGLNRVDALSLSLLVFFVVVFCSLVGGAVYLVWKDNVVKEAERFYREESADT